MKISFIINSLRHRRGAEVFLSNLVNCISKNSEIQCNVICLYDGADSSFLDLFKENGINVYYCHKKNKFDFKSFKLFRKIINDFSPDIISTHLSILITYFFSFGFRRKKWHIVHTVHSIPRQESEFFTNILRRVYIHKKMISFVGISNNISCDIKKKFKKCSCYTIYNGFKPNAFNVENRKIYDFICVASFTRVKNHRLLLELFTRVKNANTKVALIGEGPLLAEIKNGIEEMGLNETVFIFPPTRNVYDYLTASKYFILTSHYEGNPISILEAMSSGLPVLAPEVGGIPDIVESKKDGFLYKIDDLDSLINAYFSIINTDYDTLSKNAIKKASIYNIESCATEYLNYFKNCYNKK